MKIQIQIIFFIFSNLYFYKLLNYFKLEKIEHNFKQKRKVDMDKIYTLPYGFNTDCNFQNNSELLDIGQIEPLFNNDEFKM